MKKQSYIDSKLFVCAIMLAVLSVCILEIIALIKGIDGSFFGIAIAAISGMGGYLIKGFLKK